MLEEITKQKLQENPQKQENSQDEVILIRNSNEFTDYLEKNKEKKKKFDYEDKDNDDEGEHDFEMNIDEEEVEKEENKSENVNNNIIKGKHKNTNGNGHYKKLSGDLSESLLKQNINHFDVQKNEKEQSQLQQQLQQCQKQEENGNYSAKSQPNLNQTENQKQKKYSEDNQNNDDDYDNDDDIGKPNQDQQGNNNIDLNGQANRNNKEDMRKKSSDDFTPIFQQGNNIPNNNNLKNIKPDNDTRLTQQSVINEPEIESEGEGDNFEENEINQQQQQKKDKNYTSFMESFNKSVINTDPRQFIKCSVGINPVRKDQKFYSQGYVEFEISTNIFSGKKIIHHHNNNKIQQQQQQTDKETNKQQQKSSKEQYQNQREVTARRRFSEFDLLYQYLITMYENTIIYILPSKSSLMDQLSYRLNFIQEQQSLKKRANGLKEFLNENGNKEVIQNDEIFKHFINFNNNTEQMEAQELSQKIQNAMREYKAQKLYGTSYNDIAQQFQQVIEKQLNSVLNLGFDQRMDDYNSTLDIEKMPNFQQIQNLKAMIQKYLLNLNNLDQLVTRKLLLVSEVSKNTEKSIGEFDRLLDLQKIDGKIYGDAKRSKIQEINHHHHNNNKQYQQQKSSSIQDIEGFEDCGENNSSSNNMNMNKQQLKENKLQHCLDSQKMICIEVIQLAQRKSYNSESLELKYNKVIQKINKCKGILQTMLSAYNKHIQFIEEKGQTYKKEIEELREQSQAQILQQKKKKLQQQQQQQQNQNNSDSNNKSNLENQQNEGEYIIYYNNEDEENEDLMEGMFNMVKQLDKKKLDLQQKMDIFQKELKELLNVRFKKKFISLKKTLLLVENQYAQEMYQANQNNSIEQQIFNKLQ